MEKSGKGREVERGKRGVQGGGEKSEERERERLVSG